MHDNYVKVGQISLYNEKNHFYYDSIEYMCWFCLDMIRYVFSVQKLGNVQEKPTGRATIGPRYWKFV